MIRRIITNDSGPLPEIILSKGESVLQIDRDQVPDWTAEVRQATGVEPADISCELVHPGGVVHVIKADPDVDVVPEGFILRKLEP